MIIDGLNDNYGNAQMAVVFGNKVNLDGTISNRLRARLDHSINLYRNNRIEKIIVSGGLGKEGFWEGTEMKKYLVQNKISSEDVYIDNYGNNTERTVQNSIRIANTLNCNSIITVSQYFHQTRIKKLYRQNSFNNVQSSSPIFFEFRDFYSIIREFFAFYFG